MCLHNTTPSFKTLSQTIDKGFIRAYCSDTHEV
jgi:hypothetical protein